VVIDLVTICDLGKPHFCCHMSLLDGPCFLLRRSMTHNYFGSSGFGPFQCIALTILRSVEFRSVRSGTACPLVLDGRDLLREFGLQAFFSCFLAQFSEVSNSQSERSGDVWPLDLDGRDLLREFGLRAFSMHSSYNPPKC
jgi:hypothetical protein